MQGDQCLKGERDQWRWNRSGRLSSGTRRGNVAGEEWGECAAWGGRASMKYCVLESKGHVWESTNTIE